MSYIPGSYSSYSSYSNYFATSSDTTGASVFGYLYGIGLVLFIIFLILVFIHFTIYPVFALTPNEPGMILISGTADREKAYTGSDGNVAVPANPRNKSIPHTTLPDICNYTVGADVYIDGSLLTTYPVPIFYRDNAPIQAADAQSATPGNFNLRYHNTNIIAWVKGDTKELYVTFMTTDKGGNTVEESMKKPIATKDKEWFRLTVVLSSSFAEIYHNWTLDSTVNLVNPLKQITNTDFYPPPVEFPVGGVEIRNMSMWPRILTPKEIRTYEVVTN